MPRDIPVGNGQMLVCFDDRYQIRDLYFPHVGQENHAGVSPCRFGVWAALGSAAQPDERKRHRLYWSTDGWQIESGYQPDTLATRVRMTHDKLALQLDCCDVVDFHRPILIRRIDVTNHDKVDREVRLFHHNDFHMYGTRMGDTAYYDPQLRCVIHYRQSRYLMSTWWADGEHRVDEYATGVSGFRGAEGTWRDAEDGSLGNNAIAQGAVDSTTMLSLQVPAGQTQAAYLIIGAGQTHQDIYALHEFLLRRGPQESIDRTMAYWRLWLDAAFADFPTQEQGGLPGPVVELFKRSLLVVRSQIDNSGAIIAANDSDIMQFSRDTYSYLWPRDGAMVAAALDTAGFPDVARSFYSLCSRIITDQGYFLHKYNPDGSLASSWHPWISQGKPQLPIQEDETALVLWALWRHYEIYRDIEFVRPLWVDLITRAADFLARYRDPVTKLPLPSYDLWEERWGVHAFTVATVHAGLLAAHRFAVCFGDLSSAARYRQAAEEIKQAFCKLFWSQADGRFYRRLVPLDHARTADLMAQVMAGRTPAAAGNGHAESNGQAASPPASPPAPPAQTDTAHPDDVQQDQAQRQGPFAFEYDAVVDSSMYAIFAMGLLEPGDPRVIQTMQAIEQKLTIKTEVGGLARYESDHYHQVVSDAAHVPGNPWFICTLWLADWHIARATSLEQLQEAVPIFEWVVRHALPSGVLAEQVHPMTNAPLSVSPLTWSHATVVNSVMGYYHKLEQMNACRTCGQPRQCQVGHDRPARTRRRRRQST